MSESTKRGTDSPDSQSGDPTETHRHLTPIEIAEAFEDLAHSEPETERGEIAQNLADMTNALTGLTAEKKDEIMSALERLVTILNSQPKH